MANPKVFDLMDEFIALCKQRGFHKESASVLGIMAGSRAGIACFGDEETAFQELIKIAENYTDEQDLLDEYARKLEPFYK